MSSWYDYQNWDIKVKECVKPYTCSEWKKLSANCSELFEYAYCKLSCWWDNTYMPDRF